MSIKYEIVEALDRIRYEEDSKKKYDVILEFVRKQKIEVTRNKRGFWFDLTPVPDTVARDLYQVVMQQLRTTDSVHRKDEDVS